MSQQGHESDDPFPLENHSWANLSNDASVNSERDEDKGQERGRRATKRAKGKGQNVEKKQGGETSNHEIHIWTERERRKKMRNMFSNLHSLLPHLLPKADKTTVVDEAISYIQTLESTLQKLEKQKLERLERGSYLTTNSLVQEPSVVATSRLAMLSTREKFMADQVYSMTNNTNDRNKNNSVVSRTSTTFSASTSHLPVIIQTWTSPNVVLNICGNDAQFTVYVPKKHGILTTICCVLEKHKLEVISAHISSHDDRSTVYMIQARVANGAYDQFPELMTAEDVYKLAAGEMTLWVSS